MFRKVLLFLGLFVAFVSAAFPTVFGTVRGVVHDPQHRPVAAAQVKIKSATSDWTASAQTDQEGLFSFTAVPVGDYLVSVAKSGFGDEQQSVTVVADSSPALHFQLKIGTMAESTTVTASTPLEVEGVDSVTPTTLINRADIAQTPGADRTNSMAMITDYVPAAYVTHDMLHMRGGHQVNWLIDGVPIPNTNIATNLGPQIDPKDIDYLDIQRGSYEPSYGDRTYGMFNIVPRTGFESNNEGELVLSFGNFYQTNDQINFGSHTERFAYYASFNGNRSDYGLQTPISQVFHDAENGYGGFATLIFNLNPKDQLRVVTSLRQDYYQIPIDPDANSSGNQVYPSYGLRDGEHETDGYVAFSWVHTVNSNFYFTLSPFYHHSDAHYQASPNDTPVVNNVNQTSNYGGLQASFNANLWKNEIEGGVYGFAQRQNNYFYNFFQPCVSPCSTANNPSLSTGNITGGVQETFIGDKFKVTPWLTLLAGLRQTHFTADIVENTVYPRFGVAVQVPKLKWVFHAFYGKYYQPPPLLTITGPLLELAAGQNFTFAPLHGERDEEHQFGVTIPFRGWALDADTYQTLASNWLDHNNIGESNIFWPITWYSALIQGWELTLRSPRLWHRGQFHLAYSNQIAQATSPITGGLICPPPVSPTCGLDIPPGYAPVDHDQRNTLNLGFNGNLPWQSFASVNMYYGSGFTNGMPNSQYPGAYLPSHTNFDIAVGKSFGEKYTIGLNALNVGNRRVLLDNSLTFGGFHYNDPREIYAEFRYRFHY
ncbi:MAG TPA: TonB-dependent receptor [Candidatus Eremiobacteraceae bacterium]|nr:TonB-dependent receptor [Candidatus Eremiobacteraceae bacterium]